MFCPTSQDVFKESLIQSAGLLTAYLVLNFAHTYNSDRNKKLAITYSKFLISIRVIKPKVQVRITEYDLTIFFNYY